MAAGSVIVNFDGLKQLPAKGGSIHQPLTVNALNRRIIVAVASAAHAGDQSMAADQISLLPATVNATTVGVHDDSVGRAAPGNGCFERITGELPINSLTARPANHLAGAKIDDHCQVQPALRGAQVGDVTSPLLIRALRAEVLVKQVGGDTQPVARIGGAPKASRRSGTQTQPAHALGHCLAVHRHALGLQLFGFTRQCRG